MDSVPELYHVFNQTLGQGICQLVLLFNIFISIGYEFANKLKVSMSDDASEDPIDTEYIELKIFELGEEIKRRVNQYKE